MDYNNDLRMLDEQRFSALDAQRAAAQASNDARAVYDRDVADLLARIAALEAALRDCLRVFDGVRQAETYVARWYFSESVVAEMAAHYNGYSGGPDMARAAATARALLEE